MVYLNTRLAGKVVANVIAHATDDMVGLYGTLFCLRTGLF